MKKKRVSLPCSRLRRKAAALDGIKYALDPSGTAHALRHPVSTCDGIPGALFCLRQSRSPSIACTSSPSAKPHFLPRLRFARLSQPGSAGRLRLLFASFAVLILAALTWPVLAFEPDINDPMELDVQRAIIDIKRADPGIETFFNNAAGYAVFPSVGKGGVVVGGAFGRGLVIVDEKVDGYTSMSQGTIGLQLGGQKYAQFIFFKDQTAIDHFRRGNFEFGAQASAVAITAGASADAAYDSGVAVFTHAGGGLMIEGTVGGQRFKYKPKTD